MKYSLFLITLCLLSLTITPAPGRCSSTPEEIDPCGLIAADKVLAAFPELQKAEKQKVGPMTMCNFLDKFGIPALTISLTRAADHARDSLSLLDSGYEIKDIPNLGDEAAVAIQQANPAFGLKEGVAALHVKKGRISLNLSFTRIDIPAGGAVFDQVKQLAAEMLEKI